MDQLLEKAELALEQTGVRNFCLAGGVACNCLLRRQAEALCAGAGVRFCAPPPILCTDNAAMIGFAASYRFQRGERADLDLNAVPSMPLPAR